MESNKSKRIKNRAIATLISIALLILALADWPYGYYVLLRLFVCGTTGYLACIEFNRERQGWTWILGFIALIFNPLFPLHFDREVWSIIDLGVAVILIVYLVVNKKIYS